MKRTQNCVRVDLPRLMLRHARRARHLSRRWLANIRTAEKVEEVETAILETKSNNDILVVDFYADWCGPCKQIAAEMDTLEDKDVSIVKVDIDALDEAALMHHVEALPTLDFYRNGERIHRAVGAIPLASTLASLK